MGEEVRAVIKPTPKAGVLTEFRKGPQLCRTSKEPLSTTKFSRAATHFVLASGQALSERRSETRISRSCCSASSRCRVIAGLKGSVERVDRGLLSRGPSPSSSVKVTVCIHYTVKVHCILHTTKLNDTVCVHDGVQLHCIGLHCRVQLQHCTKVHRCTAQNTPLSYTAHTTQLHCVRYTAWLHNTTYT